MQLLGFPKMSFPACGKNTYVCKHSRAPMLIASLARLHQTCSHDKIDTARPLPMSTVPNTIITEAFVVFID